MIFVLNHTVSTKKMYRKCGFYKKITQRTVPGSKILGSSEYKTKHDNTVKRDTAGNLVEKRLNLLGPEIFFLNFTTPCI